MRRIVFLLALTLVAPAAAQEKKDPAKKEGEGLSGSVADETLATKAPAPGVITTKARFEQLVKDWDIKDKLDVNFEKELVVVATTRGSRLNLTPMVRDGDLRVLAISTRDLRPGFRYAIKKLDKEGVKTVEGKPLPKE